MTSISRRKLLASGGTLAALPLLGSTSIPAWAQTPMSQAGGMQFDDPQHNLDALIRLRGGTDNKVRFFSGVGRAFAIFKDEIAVPLFDAKAVAWEQNERLKDGSYLRQTSFVQYHYGLDGGDADDWVNPITGKSIKLPVFKNEFGEVTFTTRGTVTPPEMKVKTLEGDKERVYPWVVMDDDVWLPKEENASYFSQREQRTLIENSVRTYHTSLAALNDLGMPSVPTTMVESAASGLFGFLDLPEEKKDGYMMWRFLSKKYETRDELPDGIRKEIDAKNPELWNTKKS